MIENTKIGEFIRAFFRKDYSEDVQMRFRYWFSSKSDKKEKEDIEHEIWDECPSDVTDQTWKALAKISPLIAKESRSSRVFSMSMKIAALIVVMAVSAFVMRMIDKSSITSQPQKMLECYVPNGKQSQKMLPDGSIVWLNSGSSLLYPEKFSGNERIVYLTGEARFQVQKDPDKPFIVSTNFFNVKALGTIFNVNSYPDSFFTSTSLEEGSIRVDVKAGINRFAVLAPNQEIIYDSQADSLMIVQIDARLKSSWKDGFLIFENASLAEIINALERKYCVNINYNANKYDESVLYVRFNPDESVDDALHVLSNLIEGFRYSVSGQTINIY